MLNANQFLTTNYCSCFAKSSYLHIFYNFKFLSWGQELHFILLWSVCVCVCVCVHLVLIMLLGLAFINILTTVFGHAPNKSRQRSVHNWSYRIRAADTSDKVPSPVQSYVDHRARPSASQSPGNGSDLNLENYLYQMTFFIKRTTNFQSEGGKNENDSIIVDDEIYQKIYNFSLSVKIYFTI